MRRSLPAGEWSRGPRFTSPGIELPRVAIVEVVRARIPSVEPRKADVVAEPGRPVGQALGVVGACRPVEGQARIDQSRNVFGPGGPMNRADGGRVVAAPDRQPFHVVRRDRREPAPVRPGPRPRAAPRVGDDRGQRRRDRPGPRRRQAPAGASRDRTAAIVRSARHDDQGAERREQGHMARLGVVPGQEGQPEPQDDRTAPRCRANRPEPRSPRPMSARRRHRRSTAVATTSIQSPASPTATSKARRRSTNRPSPRDRRPAPRRRRGPAPGTRSPSGTAERPSRRDL